MRTTKIMTRTTRFPILVVLRLPTFNSNFGTLLPINPHPFSVSLTAEIELVICDKPDRVKKLLDHKKDTPRLRVIVHIEPVPEDEVKRAKSCGVDLIKYTDLEVSTKSYIITLQAELRCEHPQDWQYTLTRFSLYVQATPLSTSTQTRSVWWNIWNYKFSQSNLEKMREGARVNRYLLAETEPCKRV